MKLIFSFLFSILAGLPISAQTPSVFHFNLTNQGGSENNPNLYKASNGGYYLVYQVIKSNPDSTFGCIAKLNSSFEVQWNRMFKLLAKTSLAGIVNENGGGVSFMLNGNTSNSFYRPYWLKLDAAGVVQQTIHVVDSSNLNSSFPIFTHVLLENGSRILATSSSGRLMRLNTNGAIDFCRYFRFQGLSTKGFFLNQVIAQPGTNTWYALGGLNGGGPAALLKFQDTTMVFNRLYNFNSPGSTNGFRSVAIYPNGDLLTLITEGVSTLTLARINPAGTVIWKKSHKASGQSSARVHLASNGDIWISGALNAGQAGGFLAHYGPTGDYLAHKGQFKLGFSQQTITTVLEEPNGQLSLVNKAYYSNSNVLMVNQINPTMDFVCYDYPSGPFSDTTFNLVDSTTTQLEKYFNRFGTTTNLSAPLISSLPTLVKGPVTCVTSNDETTSQPKIRIYPNPAQTELNIEGIDGHFTVILYSPLGQRNVLVAEQGKVLVENLPPGVYWLEIPDRFFRTCFVRE